MNEHTPADDHALARLRATDPAAGSAPDHTALRDAVRRRVAADALAAPSSPGAYVERGEEVDVELDGRPRDELAAARARRWTTWPARAAAVAAAALVVGGGGGYAIGAAGGGGDDPAAGVITLGEPGTGGAGSGTDGAGQEITGASPLGAPEAARGGSGGADAMWPGGGGRTVFTASGLSGAAGSAQAWGFDTSAAFTAEAAARAAAALGLQGEPTLVDGLWTVGPNDGASPTLQLVPDGSVSLSYWDPTTDPWACAVAEGSEGSGEASGSSSADPGAGGEIMPVPEPEPCTQRDLGAAPSAEEAGNRLREVLAALSLDPASYELISDEDGDDAWTYVTAYQVVDGQRSGVAWGATFTGGGLQSLYGSTAPLVDLGEYPVVSPADAVARLMDPRFGSWGGPVMWAGAEAGAVTDGDTAVSSEAPVEPTTPTLPGTPAPGSAVAWPVGEVTIVEARLGVAMHTQPDGSVLLLPSYELVGDDGGVWSVVAVADDHLDFSSAS